LEGTERRNQGKEIGLKEKKADKPFATEVAEKTPHVCEAEKEKSQAAC